MSGPTLDPRFARALRGALVERVRAGARPGRHRWRRPAVTGLGVLVVAAAGAGVAGASGWSPLQSSWLPGAPRDAALGPVLQSTRTGSASIPTDDAPTGATSVEVTVSCLDAGTLQWPDGSSSTCDGALGGPSPIGVLDLPPDGAPLVFTAPAGMRWGLSMTYVHREQTDWAVNARGETYGTQKEDGARPDLLAAVATNGVQGYFRTSEFDAAHGTGPTSPEDAAAWYARPVVVVEIPVYASDGTTVLGQFDVPTNAPGAVGVARADRGPRAVSTVVP
ncbi:hypothetical protein ACUN7V_12395 [Quadrisphaera oryzae]|uniref:hypothetical protein n=1 Tax=Quadrisphaera TaxID=317661 RepID=UPI001648749A|nr:hypothetical protein [Quadrisphaera sp. RL12-1S]MBC3762006.1 hypothetical protein [Quadrisphaera sp. RL12-1S]